MQRDLTTLNCLALHAVTVEMHIRHKHNDKAWLRLSMTLWCLLIPAAFRYTFPLLILGKLFKIAMYDSDFLPILVAMWLHIFLHIILRYYIPSLKCKYKFLPYKQTFILSVQADSSSANIILFKIGGILTYQIITTPFFKSHTHYLHLKLRVRNLVESALKIFRSPLIKLRGCREDSVKYFYSLEEES